MCVCVCVCARACVRVCACMRACVHTSCDIGVTFEAMREAERMHGAFPSIVYDNLCDTYYIMYIYIYIN